ncbi:hypothetical protein U2T19_004916 [Salmonella enterica]|nr:hypothetical protein [Salmonella enterica]EGI1955540.1 hypothetical protein [Salmonella enterica]EMA3598567.1 hypothetical protein [Salmonella enterica]
MDEMVYRKKKIGELHCKYQLGPDILQEKFRKYSFEECSTVLAFIELFCIPTPDRSALLYILSKTEECIHNHDNGSNYFNTLREIAQDIKIYLEELALRDSISC